MSQTAANPLRQREETIKQQYQAIQGESACTPPRKGRRLLPPTRVGRGRRGSLPQGSPESLQALAGGTIEPRAAQYPAQTRLTEKKLWPNENAKIHGWLPHTITLIVMCQEQGLPLTKKQRQALASLTSFGDETDDRILYINEIPRPREPWYEIARKIAPRLLQEPFKTDALYYGATLEGWSDLVACLEEYGQDLSLPEGAKSPLDIFPVDLRYRLELQSCFDALHGLGQVEDLSLANEEQQHRVVWFANLLREHKDIVQYFDLTLEKLLTRIILPPQEEKIFIDMVMKELGLTSSRDRLVDFL